MAFNYNSYGESEQRVSGTLVDLRSASSIESLSTSDSQESKTEVSPVEPKNIGMFSVVTANAAIVAAEALPDPKDLFMGLWHGGEIACLFADSNLGKSILAVQIAEEIAREQKVIYFDCELSDKQFQLRYSDTESKVSHTFPENLYRATINPIGINGSSFEDAIISDIEKVTSDFSAEVIIIDNLTYLCNASEKGDAAGELMMRLMTLKMKHGWSVLVIAHTPKRETTSPISTNDLAGSKKLFNFFDTIFAIGKCRFDDARRYIIQMKVRCGEFKYTSDNVLVCEIAKDNDAFLRFDFIGESFESKMLKDPDNSALIDKICGMRASRLSIREIAERLKMSKSKVGRLAKQCSSTECTLDTSDAASDEEDSSINDDNL